MQRNIGVTAQDATVDEILTGRQNLVMIGRLSGLRRREARARATELLDLPRSQPSRKMLPRATAATMVALRGLSLPEFISE